MKDQITTSIATSNERNELTQLLALLFQQEQEFEPSTAKQDKALDMILSNPNVGDILVARDQGKIVGMVNLLYTVSTALGGPVALLEDMVVAPEARAKGVGSVLMDNALKQAKLKGCLRVTLLTDSDNEAAHRFYQRNGFERSSMLVMRQQLPMPEND